MGDLEHHWGHRRSRKSVISGGGQFRLVESQIFSTTFCILPSRLEGIAFFFPVPPSADQQMCMQKSINEGHRNTRYLGLRSNSQLLCSKPPSPNSTQGWIPWPPVTTEPNKICMLRPPALSHLGQRCKIPRPPLPGLFVFEVLPLLRIERRLGRVREI